ncbi:MAG: universal stress protein [Gemmatimonadaceae bacterium]
MKILVPLDTSTLAERALPTAVAIAIARDASEVRLLLVHEPVPIAGFPDAPWNAARSTIERTYIEDKAHEMRARLATSVASEFAIGSPAHTIADTAAMTEADLIVMTTHGRTGLSRAWLGSVADAVMRSTNVPVLMLRPDDSHGAEPPHGFARVLLPLDGSSGAERVLGDAVALAGRGATYVLTRVVHPIPLILPGAGGYGMTSMTDADATNRAVAAAKDYLATVAGQLRERGVTHVNEHVEIGDHTAPMLIELAKAERVDLIAIAARGRGAARLLLGSVADKLLRGTSLPLLVIHRVA